MNSDTANSILSMDDDDLGCVAEALRAALAAVIRADAERDRERRVRALRDAKVNASEARAMLRNLIVIAESEPRCTACGEPGSKCACEPGGTFE